MNKLYSKIAFPGADCQVSEAKEKISKEKNIDEIKKILFDLRPVLDERNAHMQADEVGNVLIMASKVLSDNNMKKIAETGKVQSSSLMSAYGLGSAKIMELSKAATAKLEQEGPPIQLGSHRTPRNK